MPLRESGLDPERWLSAVERKRMAGYRQRDDQLRFLLGSALARAAVAGSVGIPIGEVVLDRRCRRCGEPHGPVHAVQRGAPHLSITHAGGLVGVAASIDGAVGLDVEPRADDDPLATVELAFSPDERSRLAALPESSRALSGLRYWVRKEASLKALGLGLSVEPSALDVSLADRPRPLAERLGAARHLRYADLDPPGDHVAACAGLSGGAPLSVDEADGDELLRASAER